MPRRASPGLRQALAAMLPSAAWQRCRTHFICDLLTTVLKESAEPRCDARANDLRAAGRGGRSGRATAGAPAPRARAAHEGDGGRSALRSDHERVPRWCPNTTCAEGGPPIARPAA